jgi:hypothetical protein
MALLHIKNENGPVEREKRPDDDTWYQLQVYMLISPGDVILVTCSLTGWEAPGLKVGPRKSR